MSNKPWRMSEKEFLDKVDLLISREYSRVKKMSKDWVGERQNSVKLIMGHINELLDPEYKIENRKKYEYDLRKYRLELICCDVNAWCNYSNEIHPKEDVILGVLINNIFNVEYLCLTYSLANKEQWNTDMIEDVLFIQSGLFSFECWDDYHVELITGEICKGHNHNSINLLRDAFNNPDKYDKGFYKLVCKIFEDFEKSKKKKIEAAKRFLENTITSKKYIEVKLRIIDTNNDLIKDYLDKNPLDSSLGLTYHQEYFFSLIKYILFKLGDDYDFISKIWDDLKESQKNIKSAKIFNKFIVNIRDYFATEKNSLNKQLENISSNIPKAEAKIMECQMLVFDKFILTERLDWYNIMSLKPSDTFCRKYKKLIQRSLKGLDPEFRARLIENELIDSSYL